MRRYRVALLGYYGFGNLGDELLLQSCIDLFTRCGLERERIVVLSNVPEEGIFSVNRWSLREVVNALRQSDALVLGGGGLFQDTTSVKSCVWYWGIVRLARILGCEVFALGQSVGPLKSGVSRVLAGDALRVCRKVHVRDDASLSVAESLGCRGVVRGNDLVMTLGGGWAGIRPQGRTTSAVAHDVQLLPRCMLVNLRPSPELEHYAKIITPYIDADTVGAALSDEDMKALAVLKLSRIIRVRTLEEARELWSSASCAIGMRLHFGILSRIFRTPLALMPYDVKVSQFAEQSGVPCIADEWSEPVMPREIPEDVNIGSICHEIISL